MSIYDRLLLAKIESPKGTDSVPVVADDAVRFSSAELALTADNIERLVVKDTMGPLPHLIGKKMMQLTVEMELRGSGAAGTAPDLGTLLRACGMDETISASVSVAYDPLTDSHESISMYWFEDGLRWEFLGTEGDFEISYEMNVATKISFTLSAPYKEPTTLAMPSSAVFQVTPPVVASSADTFSEGGAIKIGSYTLAAGGDVQEHYVTGLHEFVVAGRDPSLTLTKDSVSTIADWVALIAATDVALSSVVDGGAGNKITTSAPVARRKTIASGIRAERHTREVELGLYESTGDDQFQILFE